MLYVNQLDYPNMEYLTKLSIPDADIHTTVKRSGCGLCSACMIVDQLTTRVLTLEHARQISYDSKSNLKTGTSMRTFAPAVAAAFNLGYRATDSIEELAEHLRSGGKAILHVNGNYDGRLGLFTKGGHYIAAIGINGDELCILDPSYKEGKFDEPGRKGKVRVDAPFIYCPIRYLPEEQSRNASEGRYIHLFRNKTE